MAAYFEAKMHKIRFRPAGELTELPRPPSGFQWPISKEREGRAEDIRQGKGGEVREDKEGEEPALTVKKNIFVAARR